MIQMEAFQGNMPKPFMEIEGTYDSFGGKFGMQIEVRSSAFEELFKKISGGKFSSVKKNGVEIDLYDLPPMNGDVFSDLTIIGKDPFPNSPALPGQIGKSAYAISLFYLRAVGISKGMKLFYPGIFEEGTTKRYIMKAGERSEQIFKKLSPGMVKMKMWLEG